MSLNVLLHIASIANSQGEERIATQEVQRSDYPLPPKKRRFEYMQANDIKQAEGLRSALGTVGVQGDNRKEAQETGVKEVYGSLNNSTSQHLPVAASTSKSVNNNSQPTVVCDATSNTPADTSCIDLTISIDSIRHPSASVMQNPSAQAVTLRSDGTLQNDADTEPGAGHTDQSEKSSEVKTVPDLLCILDSKGQKVNLHSLDTLNVEVPIMLFGSQIDHNVIDENEINKRRAKNAKDSMEQRRPRSVVIEELCDNQLYHIHYFEINVDAKGQELILDMLKREILFKEREKSFMFYSNSNIDPKEVSNNAMSTESIYDFLDKIVPSEIGYKNLQILYLLFIVKNCLDYSADHKCYVLKQTQRHLHDYMTEHYFYTMWKVRQLNLIIDNETDELIYIKHLLEELKHLCIIIDLFNDTKKAGEKPADKDKKVALLNFQVLQFRSCVYLYLEKFHRTNYTTSLIYLAQTMLNTYPNKIRKRAKKWVISMVSDTKMIIKREEQPETNDTLDIEVDGSQNSTKNDKLGSLNPKHIAVDEQETVDKDISQFLPIKNLKRTHGDKRSNEGKAKPATDTINHNPLTNVVKNGNKRSKWYKEKGKIYLESYLHLHNEESTKFSLYILAFTIGFATSTSQKFTIDEILENKKTTGLTSSSKFLFNKIFKEKEIHEPFEKTVEKILKFIVGVIKPELMDDGLVTCEPIDIPVIKDIIKPQLTKIARYDRAPTNARLNEYRQIIRSTINTQ